MVGGTVISRFVVDFNSGEGGGGGRFRRFFATIKFLLSRQNCKIWTGRNNDFIGSPFGLFHEVVRIFKKFVNIIVVRYVRPNKTIWNRVNH